MGKPASFYWEFQTLQRDRPALVSSFCTPPPCRACPSQISWTRHPWAPKSNPASIQSVTQQATSRETLLLDSTLSCCSLSAHSLLRRFASSIKPVSFSANCSFLFAIDVACCRKSVMRSCCTLLQTERWVINGWRNATSRVFSYRWAFPWETLALWIFPLLFFVHSQWKSIDLKWTAKQQPPPSSIQSTLAVSPPT